MSATDYREESGDPASQLLAIARETMEKVKNCWLVTVALGGEASARIVAPIPGVPDESEWIVWVLTSSGSRKIDEIQRDCRVTLGYQHDPESAYVALAGHATIVKDRVEISKRWKQSWDNVFHAGAEDADAVFVKIEVDRIELFSIARKVTPEPFCKRSAALARDATGNWRVA